MSNTSQNGSADHTTIGPGSGNGRRVSTKTFPVFDCDAHVYETPELWEKYVEPRHQDVVRESYWTDSSMYPRALLNGKKTILVGATNVGRGGAFNQGTIGGPGITPKTIRKLRSMQLSPEQLDYLDHKGTYDPGPRLTDMDLIGTDQVMIVPTTLLRALPLVQRAHGAAYLAQAYNNWVYDYCQVQPQRLFPAAVVPLQSLDFAIAELRRVAKLGFKCALIRPTNANEIYPLSPAFDPLWAEFQELDLVLGIHTLAAYPYMRESEYCYSPGELIMDWDNTGLQQDLRSNGVSFIYEAVSWLGGALLSGLLDRFPRLTMAIFESNATWLTSLLQRCDRFFHLYGRQRSQRASRLPSEAFRQQCFIGFESDETAVYRMANYFADVALWASDAYHHDASDAWSALDKMGEVNVPESIQAKFLGGNAYSMLKIEPKLFVSERPVSIPRPDWFPTDEEIEAFNASGQQVKEIDSLTSGWFGPTR